MRPTVTYLRNKFDYYNKLCFDGTLPQPIIRLNTRYCVMGITKFENTREKISIEISVRRDLPEMEYIDTLLHEMIHYYIIYNGINDDSPHGKQFKSIMHEISTKYGIKISLCFEPSEEELVKTHSRIRFICVANLVNDNVGFAVVAKNKVWQFWDMIPRMKKVKSVKWFISDRAIFESFPVIVSPKLFIIKADKIHHYLTGAKELVKSNNIIKVVSIRYDKTQCL